MRFCHFQEHPSHLISQNSSPHARHVSLDGMSVIHRIKVLEPDQNAEISGIVCEPDGQNAGEVLDTCSVKMLEFMDFFVNQTQLLGSLVKRMVRMLELSGVVLICTNAGLFVFFVISTIKMLEFLGLFVNSTLKSKAQFSFRPVAHRNRLI